MQPIIVAALVGIGGTIVLDGWNLLLRRVLRTPTICWPAVGRWIGNMPKGRFRHANMAEAPPIAAEAVIGWSAHYGIGVGYGLLVYAGWGTAWLARPSALPPLIVSWLLLAAPFLIMMPGMGAGIAGSKTPSPSEARLKSALGHTVFGLGMYATALALSEIARSFP